MPALRLRARPPRHRGACDAASFDAARAEEAVVRHLDIAREREVLDESLSDLVARLAEWDQPAAADAMLDFWNDLSAAVMDEAVNAASVREANTALCERFAAIYVKTQPDGSARLDFVL